VERGARLAIAPDGRTWSDVFAPPDSIRAVVRAEDWNRYRIRATASHVTVWINDTLAAVLDDRDAKQAEFAGRLALQLHSGPGPVKLRFRDIRLTDLGATTLSARSPPLEVMPEKPEARRDWSSPVLWHTIDNQPAKQSRTGAATTNEKAAATVAGMKVTPGFRVDLIAAEPDIHQPIAFAIDPRGRLWVVEGHSYPNKRPEGQGLDRIVILADQDGDGSFETRKVFKEGLNLVSGIEVGFGGVFVGAAPHLLFIADRDGDDVPDGEPEILLDGWGLQDTHETLNGFTWGPDGWLYGCHGVFTTSDVGPPGTPPNQRLHINAGIWRYHPVGKQFEIFAHGGSNQWGIDFSSVGDAFMTHCRSFFGGGGTTHILRNGIYWNQANSGFPPFICREAPPFAPALKNFLPAAARYDSGEGGAGKKGTDAVYGGHSHVGTMVYLGDNWPEIYRDHIFTNNLHGRQMNHQEAFRQGSGYEVLHAGYDILHMPEFQSVNVDLQYGPDGAVYVIDWWDNQHCHNPATEIWDRTNGRVYRLAWAETFRPVTVDLAKKTDAELVALHTHRNEWFVRTARRLLRRCRDGAPRPLDAPRDGQPRRRGPGPGLRACRRPRPWLGRGARHRGAGHAADSDGSTARCGREGSLVTRSAFPGLGPARIAAGRPLENRRCARDARRGCGRPLPAKADLERDRPARRGRPAPRSGARSGDADRSPRRFDPLVFRPAAGGTPPARRRHGEGVARDGNAATRNPRLQSRELRGRAAAGGLAGSGRSVCRRRGEGKGTAAVGRLR
jgi:putative membrane-bound dehydrogenase-like protein